MRIKFSNTFYLSADKLFDHNSKFSLEYANNTMENIYFKINRLKNMPFIGRYVPELNNKSYRELIYNKSRIVYMVLETEVEILFVIPSSRDIIKFFNSNNF